MDRQLKIGEPTFPDYLQAVAAKKAQYPTLRMGQCYWSVLQNMRRDISDEINRGGDIDPYYSDDVLADFLAYVEVMW